MSGWVAGPIEIMQTQPGFAGVEVELGKS